MREILIGTLAALYLTVPVLTPAAGRPDSGEAKDEREALYADYELLAGRAYAELRAKKVITRDLDIQTLFEVATAFLFEARLHAACDPSRKENRAVRV